MRRDKRGGVDATDPPVFSHLSLVKHQLLKESMTGCIDDIRTELASDIKDYIQKIIEEKMNVLHFQFDTGINSILALTGE